MYLSPSHFQAHLGIITVHPPYKTAAVKMTFYRTLLITTRQQEQALIQNCLPVCYMLHDISPESRALIIFSTARLISVTDFVGIKRLNQY